MHSTKLIGLFVFKHGSSQVINGLIGKIMAALATVHSIVVLVINHRTTTVVTARSTQKIYKRKTYVYLSRTYYIL